MSIVNKIFSKRFKYHVALYLKNRLETYISELSKKEQVEKDNKWTDLFRENPYFVRQLNTGIKLKFYRDSVLSRLILEGFEQTEIEFTQKILREGDIYLDIGANVGLFSLLASAKVGPTGKVICFEPSPITFQRLVENIALNECSNIEARNLGISDEKGTLKLSVSRNGYDAWNTFAKSNDDKFQDTIDVPVSTLDIELAKIRKEDIALVKIDVEGWEKFVLEGGKEFFNQYSPIVMMEFTESNTFAAGYMVQELYDKLVNWGYQWYRYINGELVPESKKMSYPYDNLIAAKDFSLLSDRLKLSH